MEIKTTYIAFDGKEFDDEDSCMEYEFQKKYHASLNAAHFYNRRGQEKSLDTVISNEANYIFMAYLPTEEAIETFKDLWKEEGLIGTNNVTKPGFYFYEDCMCEDEELWHLVDDFPEYIANQFNSYETAKKIKEQLDNENGSL